jgi:carbon storage regulator
MLVIRRHPGQAIHIGADIEILVLDCGHGRVKLGIRAPQHIPVLRDEVRLTGEQNLAAARAMEAVGPAAAPPPALFSLDAFSVPPRLRKFLP